MIIGLIHDLYQCSKFCNLGLHEARDYKFTHMSLLNLTDYEKDAQTIMPTPHFDYYQGRCDDEVTLFANQTAYQRLQLRPRVLKDVSKINMSISVLGVSTKMPILIAPSTVHKLAHPDGEIATGRAAKSQDTIMIASTLSIYIEEIAKT